MMATGNAVNLLSRVLGSKPAPDWQPKEQADSLLDPLSDALVYLGARHGRALSREALLAWLPITDGRLSIKLFQRAALRAGLETEPVQRSLKDIPALVLPVVLIMRDGSTRILLEVDHHTKKAKVIDPSSKTAA